MSEPNRATVQMAHRDFWLNPDIPATSNYIIELVNSIPFDAFCPDPTLRWDRGVQACSRIPGNVLIVFTLVPKEEAETRPPPRKVMITLRLNEVATAAVWVHGQLIPSRRFDSLSYPAQQKQIGSLLWIVAGLTMCNGCWPNDPSPPCLTSDRRVVQRTNVLAVFDNSNVLRSVNCMWVGAKGSADICEHCAEVRRVMRSRVSASSTVSQRQYLAEVARELKPTLSPLLTVDAVPDRVFVRKLSPISMRSASDEFLVDLGIMVTKWVEMSEPEHRGMIEVLQKTVLKKAGVISREVAWSQEGIDAADRIRESKLYKELKACGFAFPQKLRAKRSAAHLHSIAAIVDQYPMLYPNPGKRAHLSISDLLHLSEDEAS